MRFEMGLELVRDRRGKGPVVILLVMVGEIFDRCLALQAKKEAIALVEEVSKRI
jgi:hypothetical protein